MNPIHLLIFTSLLVGVFGTGSRVNLESSRIPPNWIARSKLDSDETVKLYFAIKQQNVPLLEKILLEVSDPANPKYGKHLSRDEVNKLVAPSKESINTVMQWIQSEARSAQFEIHSDFINVVLPVSQAEKLLECSFHNFQHKTSPQHKLARSVNGYTVPSSVAPHLDFVGGTIHFPKIQPKKVAEEPGIGVTPRIIRDRYAIGDTMGKASNNRQAVAQFLEQFYDTVDLEEFFTLFFWPAIGNTVDRVVGDNTAYEPGTEASLDIEYIMAVGAGISTWFYSTPGYHKSQEPFLDWSQVVNNETDAEVPKVISVSYGDDEDSLSLSYMIRVNTEFQKLGSRGVSILFASGDSGVGCNDQGTKFVPSFPATSPWVTAVGGTTTDEFFELGPEIVNGLSGGGFSNYFPMPAYQKQAVATYFQRAKDLPNTSFYNQTGRAYPDVSALSSAFTIVIYGIPTPGVSGTSCAAPTFSGVVALLNDIRMQHNKGPLGFLNPFLYQAAVKTPQVFFDVTEGCNPGGCPNDGFCATSGWDPASGLGSPLYDKLAQAVLLLP